MLRASKGAVARASWGITHYQLLRRTAFGCIPASRFSVGDTNKRKALYSSPCDLGVEIL